MVCADRRWTYGELDAELSRLARLLIGRGAGRRQCRGRVAALVRVGARGVGGGEVGGGIRPGRIPRNPVGRVQHVLSDSGVATGITLSQWRDRLPGSVRWLVLDEPAVRSEVPRGVGSAGDRCQRIRPVRIDHAVYVDLHVRLDGVPKGVVVSHRGLANLVAEQCSRFEIGPGARVLHAASPSFDAAVLELLWAFASGGGW